MAAPTLKLLNCLRCDDIVKLVEQDRTCECGSSRGAAAENGSISVLGPARVLEIGWEVYDGIGEGEMKLFGVLPKHRY